MKHALKRWGALLCALAMLLALAGCGLGGDSDGKGTVPESSGGKDVQKADAVDQIFTLNSNPKYSFRPTVATNHANQLVCDLIYENMLELDDSFNVIPGAGLITEWSVTPDGKSWTFMIATDHVFHDGSLVTGNDLRMSLENAIHADRFQGRFASVQGVGYDKDRIVVVLGIPNMQFYKLLNIPVCKAGTFGDDHPIGSGPYTWDPEEENKLIAFEGWPDYENLPVKEVYIQQFTEAADILSAFEDGLIDVVVNDPSSITNLGYASTNEKRSFYTTNMHFIAFNEEGTLGRYSNVRSALGYAVDRSYFEELTRGNGVGTPVPMIPTVDIYPAALAATHGYDMERCLRILSNYGITDFDDDGRLELATGSAQEMTMLMIVPADSSVKAGMARRFAEDLAQIGFTIEIRELTWAEYTKALEDGYITEKNEEKTPYDIFYGEVKLRNDFDLTELLQVRSKENESTNINFTRSTDRTFESKINAYLAANDATRAQRYEELCQYLLDTGSLITVGFEKQEIYTHRGVIKGVEPNAGNPMYNFANWEIDLG
ncbi:MAG: ABC transporter substrate-binding protein [Oscillospiraceae bacterium]|nr:ABC transporter substrate-binding protein [Oscillospiraceae bacterium]